MPVLTSTSIGGFDSNIKLIQNPYPSLPSLPLEKGTGKSAPLPSPTDLFKLANVAWRGQTYKVFDKRNGLLFEGRDFLQWLLYDLNLIDDDDHLTYVERIAVSSFFNIYYCRPTLSRDID